MRSLPADVRACRGGKTLFPRRKTFSVSRGRAELRPETAEAGKCLFRGTVRAGRGPNGVECGLCRGGVDDFGAVVFLKTVRGISAVRRRRQDCRETFGRVQSAAERTAAFAFAMSGRRRKVDRKEKIFYRQPFSAPPLHTCTRCVSISFCCRSFCGRLGASSGVQSQRRSFIAAAAVSFPAIRSRMCGGFRSAPAVVRVLLVCRFRLVCMRNGRRFVPVAPHPPCRERPHPERLGLVPRMPQGREPLPAGKSFGRTARPQAQPSRCPGRLAAVIFSAALSAGRGSRSEGAPPSTSPVRVPEPLPFSS